ncbi:peptidylprolyl isomerase [Pedobacter sp. MC2016-14]|uniref:peptidylprolyl isomerase n=1 Tax=Pedobacter sp. MC2016-14 TaxID=2897327 RepID=UPI001E42C055|nr:peptidylprolyl isomerase [Pedobacter sp. MC2016-14]MCD0489872.1 peptidylprolyl isomerase [Pedobacter sp. MC2016-14]
MKKLFLVLLITLSVYNIKAQSFFVRLVTAQGNITLKLYDETPNHRDMFVEAIKKGIYKDAQFNRVIKSFVSQGGELDDSILKKEKLHPELGAKRLPAEIVPALFHKKGAFGAGRDDNPEKASYFNQIYLVQGKIQTDEQLDLIAKKKSTSFSDAQRNIYKTIGGVPYLDGDYTIFGEIVEGMEVAEAINAVATDKNDLPLKPVVFKAILLGKKEALLLQKKIKM